MTGRYPDRIQLAIWAGLDELSPVGSDLGIAAADTSDGGCCGGAGASSCCQ